MDLLSSDYYRNLLSSDSLGSTSWNDLYTNFSGLLNQDIENRTASGSNLTGSLRQQSSLNNLNSWISSKYGDNYTIPSNLAAQRLNMFSEYVLSGSSSPYKLFGPEYDPTKITGNADLWLQAPSTQENPTLFNKGDSINSILEYAKNNLNPSQDVLDKYTNSLSNSLEYTSIFDGVKHNLSPWTTYTDRAWTKADLENPSLWNFSDGTNELANTSLLASRIHDRALVSNISNIYDDLNSHGWEYFTSPYSFSVDDNNLFGYKYDDTLKTASYLDLSSMTQHSADYQWAKFLKDFSSSNNLTTTGLTASTSIPLALSAVTGISGALTQENIPEYLQTYLDSVFNQISDTKMEYTPFTTSGGENDFLGYATTNKNKSDFYSWGDTPLTLDKSVEKSAENTSLKRVSYGTFSDATWDRISELFGFTTKSLYDQNTENTLLTNKLYFSDDATARNLLYDVGTNKYGSPGNYSLASTSPQAAGVWTAPMTQYSGGLESLLGAPVVGYNGKLLGTSLLEEGKDIVSDAGNSSVYNFANDPYKIASLYSGGNSVNQSLGFGSLIPSATFAADSDIFKYIESLWGAQAKETQNAFVDDTNYAGMGLATSIITAGIGAGLAPTLGNSFLTNLATNSLGSGLSSLLTGSDFNFQNVLLNSGLGAAAPVVGDAVLNLIPDSGYSFIDDAVSGASNNLLGAIVSGNPTSILQGAIGGGIQGGLKDLGVPEFLDGLFNSENQPPTQTSPPFLDWGTETSEEYQGTDVWSDVETALPQNVPPSVSDVWEDGISSLQPGGVGLTIPTSTPDINSNFNNTNAAPEGGQMFDFDSWWDEGISNVLGNSSGIGLSFDPNDYSTSLNLLNTIGSGITGLGDYSNPNISLGDPNSYINTVLGNLSSNNLNNYTIPTTGSNGSPLSQGVTSALGSLLEKGLNKFLEDPIKNALTVYGGLSSQADQEEFSKQLNNLLSQGLSQSDPFGSQRAYYMQRLKNTYTNPEGYLNSPEYSAISKRRLEALERADAAQGRRSQYGARTEKMHEFDLENLTKERTMLAQLAGSGISPSQVSSLMNGVGVGSAQAQANAPGNLLFMLNQIFGGK